jgi:hypothetical protein
MLTFAGAAEWVRLASTNKSCQFGVLHLALVAFVVVSCSFDAA